MTAKPPENPIEYAAWLADLERQWQAGLIPAPRGAAAILVNPRGEVLLQQRDDLPHVSFPGFWTLPGGVVEGAETPEEAMHRELAEETGLSLPLRLWKVYRRRHPTRALEIEQIVYVGEVNVEASALKLGEGQALRFAARTEAEALPIAFGFEALLEEFWGSLPNAM